MERAFARTGSGPAAERIKRCPFFCVPESLLPFAGVGMGVRVKTDVAKAASSGPSTVASSSYVHE